MDLVETKEIYTKLTEKYDCDAFMYTEYPHKSFWSEEYQDAEYRSALRSVFANDKDAPLMLYVHIPYCEQLCWFCSCHMKITHDYEKVKRYLDVLYREIDLFCEFFDQYSITPNFREIHLGGGSPTYLLEEEFEQLVQKIRTIAASLIRMTHVSERDGLFVERK